MSVFAHDFVTNSPIHVHATFDSDRSRHVPKSAAQALLPESLFRDVSQTLDLSESRTYNSALDILQAYKLTGHFPTELEIVLRGLGVLDKITYEIRPKSPLSDLRQVAFHPNDNVHAYRFHKIMHAVEGRIGFDATPSWWARLFR